MTITTNPINNQVFDTRDLIEYREFLESSLVDSWNDYILEVEEEDRVVEANDINEVDLSLDGFVQRFQEEIEEYESIRNFCDQLSESRDFTYGESVIHEAYFTDYCEELLKDCGYIPQDFPTWIELDFEATAENMKADYTTVEYFGNTYYIRY